MAGLDWVVFGLYFASILSFAYWQSRKNVGVEGYFLANRRMPWYAIASPPIRDSARYITKQGGWNWSR